MTQRRNVDTSWLGPVLFVAEKSGARAHAMIKAWTKRARSFLAERKNQRAWSTPRLRGKKLYSKKRFVLIGHEGIVPRSGDVASGHTSLSLLRPCRVHTAEPHNIFTLISCLASASNHVLHLPRLAVRPLAHPVFSPPTLSSRMTSRKAKFKDGAAVVIGVAEGTMPVDVEDDDEEDDEDDDEAADRCLTAILTMEPAYPNATPVWRTGSLVSAPNRYCVCSPPSCDATEHSRLSLSFLPSGLCLSRRGSGGSDPAPC